MEIGFLTGEFFCRSVGQRDAGRSGLAIFRRGIPGPDGIWHAGLLAGSGGAVDLAISWVRNAGVRCNLVCGSAGRQDAGQSGQDARAPRGLLCQE